MNRRPSAFAIVLLISAALWTPPAHAAPKKLGAAVGPIRLIPEDGSTIAVAGLHRFFGTVELSPAGDGLVVSNRLSLERYLLGLNEVPLDWPEEALRAQAVAARTYALETLSRGRVASGATYGYDICATVECQVFSGADVVATSNGQRWIDAVADTEGQTILYRGLPILARYHSTSGGQTYDNEQIFTTESAYPYLQGVTSTTEEGSPLYRWTVNFPLPRVKAMIARVGWWQGGRLTNVQTIPSSQGFHYPDVLFEGERGEIRRTAEEFRDIARDLAPSMWPGDYPSRAQTTSGVLPETLPSNRYSAGTQEGSMVILGRGWGHGVGMSQWGAEGLARRGASYQEILAHYYTGVSIGQYAAPDSIEVGLAWGKPSVTVSGAFRIVDGRGVTLVRRALGTWRFGWAGTGAVQIDPPQGYGLPLEIGIVRAPRAVGIGEAVYLTIALSRPAKVATITQAAPTGFDDPGQKVKSAGRRRIPWLAPLEPGLYRVRVEAASGPVARRSEVVEIEVEPADPLPDDPLEAAAEEIGEPDGGGIPWPVWVVAGVLITVVLAGAAGSIKR